MNRGLLVVAVGFVQVVAGCAVGAEDPYVAEEPQAPQRVLQSASVSAEEPAAPAPATSTSASLDKLAQPTPPLLATAPIAPPLPPR